MTSPPGTPPASDGLSPGFAAELAATLASVLHAPVAIDGWAVHAGGRSILDSVQNAFGLGANALDASRAVLAENGNMSSATLMFVLARLIDAGRSGVAVAFGPGLAAEGFRFAPA